MKAGPIEPRAWPRGRWWLFVALAFAAHVGLIFALGDRKPIVARQPSNVPSLHLLTSSSELLELNDPTLFALPHLRGFSGMTWRQIPSPELRPTRGPEPLRWYELPVDKLGSAFAQFAQTNGIAAFELESSPPSRVAAPAPLPPETASPAQSTWRLGGGLAQRHLLSELALPAVTNAELLNNSEVQLLVDAAGVVKSHVLLVSSGSKDADQRAEDLARAARFTPLPGGETELSLGRLIFEWQTVPPPATNALTNP